MKRAVIFAFLFWSVVVFASEECICLPDFSSVAERVNPSVVNIFTTRVVRVPQNDVFSFFFSQLYGRKPPKELKRRSLGSGFVLDKEGFIATNYHVVRDASEIKVKLYDGSVYTAKVVGYDPGTDLALLKIKANPDELKPALLGDSDKLKIGEWVLAVGNPFGLRIELHSYRRNCVCKGQNTGGQGLRPVYTDGCLHQSGKQRRSSG